MISTRIKKSVALLTLSASLVLLGTSLAFARNIESYDLIVPRVGGTDYTNPTAKVNSSRGVDNNTSIGGGYVQYTAIYRGTTTQVTQQAEIRSGSRVTLPYNSGQNQPGTGYRLGHTNKLTTLVRVQARGTWSPDEY